MQTIPLLQTTLRSCSSIWVSRWLTAALGLLLLSHAVRAQETGTITGRVYDEDSGKSLQGAIVRVAGSAATDTIDASGQFLISSVPTGSATVEIEYLGLDRFAATVNVPAGASVNVQAALADSVIELEMLVVREAAMGQALAINQQKTAEGIVNIVAEETFGQMVDGNIGQALQRLPGLSVNEDQDGAPSSINIRGIAGEFNSFQIDGNRAPTSGGSRSFNPRQLAADGISNIEVIKAPTPDRDGDAIGGIVNVVSRTAFQRDGRQVTLKAAGVWNEEPNKWGHSGSLSYSNLFGVGGAKKNLGLSFTVSSHKTDRYSLNADMDWVQVDPATNPELNLGQFDDPVWFMEANHWEYDTRVTRTHGLTGSIDFRTDEHNSFYIRPQFSHHDRRGIKFETDIDIDTRFQNAANGRKTYAELTPNSGRGTPGDDGSRGSRGWIGTDEDAANDLYAVAFGGRHEKDATLLTYDFYCARTENDVKNDTEFNMLMEPDDPWFVFDYEMLNPTEGRVNINVLNGVDSSDLGLLSDGELIQGTSRKIENVYSARVDWSRRFTSGQSAFTVKSGAKHRVSKPLFDQTVEVYEMDEDFPYASVVEPTDQVTFLKPKYFDVYPRRGQALLLTNPELFELNEEDTLADSNAEDYDAEEATTAAYVMGTLQFGPHTIIGGVRFERNEWENVNQRVSYFDGEPSVDAVNHRDSYSHWLPGLHFRHELRPDLILRESYNRSYGRPRLSELTRGRFTNEDGDIEDGNPDLQPATADNFDVQLEYYTERGGLYSVGFFYKDVQDFTYTQVYDFDVLDAEGIPVPAEDGEFEYEHPVNGAGAVNYGLELIGRQRLYFLPGAMKGLSVALSATLTESEAEYPNRTDDRDLPLEGFSKLLYTATLDYAWRGVRARVDYRFRDDYIEGLGDTIESDEFFAAEARVDAELSYRLREGLLLYVNATNLTNRPQVSYQGYRPFVEDSSFSGRKFTFGAEYTF